MFHIKPHQLDMSQGVGGFVWLFVLLVLTFLRLDGTGAESNQALQQANDLLLHHESTTNKSGQTESRKCRPMLNIILPNTSHIQIRGGDNVSVDMLQAKKVARTNPGMPDNFTFTIQDIDMPLTQTGSPIQSAMRLLSTFDSQLGGFGLDNDDQEALSEADSMGEKQRENSIRFVRNKLHISNMNMTMLNFHLYAESQPKFGLAVNIGNVTLVGQFFYDGLTPSLLGGDFVSKLAGHYRMFIDNVLVTASSNLTKIMVADSNMTEQQYRLITNDLKMNISNLGYISIDILDAQDKSKPTSNYVLKMLQRVLQKTIKRTYNKFEGYIRQTLETEGRRFLDCELTRFSPILKENQVDPLDLASMSSDKTNNLDDLARIVSSELKNSHLDRVSTPNFEYQRTVLGSSAMISFSNGSISGLDHLRLLGETRLKLQDDHLIINASIGWFDLRPSYNWTLYLGNAAQMAHQQLSTGEPISIKSTANGFVAANIKAIEFDTLISRNLRQLQSHVTVDELNIRFLDGPKMDIGGLPGMNRLARGSVNFLMARLKSRLVNTIQPSLKLELERVLNRLAI